MGLKYINTYIIAIFNITRNYSWEDLSIIKSASCDVNRCPRKWWLSNVLCFVLIQLKMITCSQTSVNSLYLPQFSSVATAVVQFYKIRFQNVTCTVLFSSSAMEFSRRNWMSSSLGNSLRMGIPALKCVLPQLARKSSSWLPGHRVCWERKAAGFVSWPPSSRRGSTSPSNRSNSMQRKLPLVVSAPSLKPNLWDTNSLEVRIFVLLYTSYAPRFHPR